MKKKLQVTGAGTGSQFTGEFVEKFNKEQLEIRKDVPSLYDCLQLAQEGKDDYLNLFTYYHMTLEKINGYTYEVRRLQTMDSQINTFLRHMVKKYSGNVTLHTKDTKNKMAYSVSIKTDKFDEEEIYAMFASYIIKFHENNDLTRFIGENEKHTLNKLRKYMKQDFELNHLVVEYNKRCEVERVQVNGEKYVLKNKTEEVLYDSVSSNSSHDADGNSLHLLDTLQAFDGGIGELFGEELEIEKGFIFENYREVFTKNQLEKFDALLEWAENNDINELFKKNNPNIINKSQISRVLFPNKKTTATMKGIDDLLNSMNKRMNKRMNDVENEVTEKPKLSSFIPLPNSSKQDNILFKKYQINKFVIGLERTTLSDSPMYASVQIHTPQPFIMMDDYQLLLKGKITTSQLIEMYKEQFEPLNHVNGEIVISLPVIDETDIHDWEVPNKEVSKHLDWHVRNILERINNGAIQFTHTLDSKLMKPNTKQLNLIPVEEVEKLRMNAPVQNWNIICKYYNKNTFNVQPKKYKVISRSYRNTATKRTYISPTELQRIQLDEKQN